MTGAEVIDVGRDALLVTLMVSAPVMLVALGVGLVISLFQALTQIQEMTLTFVPKILAIYAALLLFMPFMGRTMAAFMARISDRIVSGGG